MIHQIMSYLQLNWLQDVIDVIAGINIVVAGAKAMGWTKLADGCQRIEGAIQAMISAALNRNQPGGKSDVGNTTK